MKSSPMTIRMIELRTRSDPTIGPTVVELCSVSFPKRSTSCASTRSNRVSRTGAGVGLGDGVALGEGVDDGVALGELAPEPLAPGATDALALADGLTDGETDGTGI